MSYYTDYKLTIKEGEVQEELLEKVFKEITDYDLDDIRDVTWRNDFEDMLKLSLKFKDVLFELSGDGEEKEDIWKAYFKNGLGYREMAEIKYQDYDESKLKNYI